MKIAVIQIDYQNKIFHPLKTTLFVDFIDYFTKE